MEIHNSRDRTQNIILPESKTRQMFANIPCTDVPAILTGWNDTRNWFGSGGYILPSWVGKDGKLCQKAL